mmetsp:Transcript_54590/g.168092  ORF Transcript_54590/g.168092 Transcript_54590/m.168092 type:complete len:220 (-) Transcript_54590:862-1521(-)
MVGFSATEAPTMPVTSVRPSLRTRNSSPACNESSFSRSVSFDSITSPLKCVSQSCLPMPARAAGVPSGTAVTRTPSPVRCMLATLKPTKGFRAPCCAITRKRCCRPSGVNFGSLMWEPRNIRPGASVSDSSLVSALATASCISTVREEPGRKQSTTGSGFVMKACSFKKWRSACSDLPSFIIGSPSLFTWDTCITSARQPAVSAFFISAIVETDRVATE